MRRRARLAKDAAWPDFPAACRPEPRGRDEARPRHRRVRLYRPASRARCFAERLGGARRHSRPVAAAASPDVIEHTVDSARSGSLARARRSGQARCTAAPRVVRRARDVGDPPEQPRLGAGEPRARARASTRAGAQRRGRIAGSCLEYDWQLRLLRRRTGRRATRTRSTARPSTRCGCCSKATRRTRGSEPAWARVFFLYGPHEHPDRLVASVIRALLRRRARAARTARRCATTCTLATSPKRFVQLLGAADVQGTVQHRLGPRRSRCGRSSGEPASCIGRRDLHRARRHSCRRDRHAPRGRRRRARLTRRPRLDGRPYDLDARPAGRRSTWWRHALDAERHARMTAPPAYSIIIPTYRRPDMLGECLASLCALDYPLDRARGPDRRQRRRQNTTSARRAPFRSRLALRYLVNRQNRGYGYSVNRGIVEARAIGSSCSTTTPGRRRIVLRECDELLASDPTIGCMGAGPIEQGYQALGAASAGSVRRVKSSGNFDVDCGEPIEVEHVYGFCYVLHPGSRGARGRERPHAARAAVQQRQPHRDRSLPDDPPRRAQGGLQPADGGAASRANRGRT